MIILYILLTLVLLSIMVVIHEFGHFIFAKIFGVKVLEFSIGMGPAIYTTKKRKKKDEIEFGQSFNSPNPDSDNTEVKTKENESEPKASDKSESNEKTVFSIRAFPIGGFVSMEGENGESDDENAYSKKKPWQKIIISIAGPVMNIILGIICMFIIVLMDAKPVSNNNDGNGNVGYLASNVVAEFINIEYEDGTSFNSNSDKSPEPLMVNDRIIKINNVRVHTGQEVVYEITNHGYEPVDIVVERNGERITLHNVSFPTEESQGVKFGSYDFKVYSEPATFKNIMKHAVFRSFSTIKLVIDSIVDLFRGRYGIEAVSGPVGVAEVVGQAAQLGFGTILNLFTLITMNLGVFNLLPFPALDGGHIVLHIYEMIARKPVKKEVEQAINTVGLVLLMGFALFITIKDVFGLF